MIPGIQGRWEYMAPTVDALSASFDVVTFSLRGAGLDDYVRQVAQALDERGIERAVVCGVSFGGVIARRFAAAHPERTLALILASTPGPGFHLRPRHDVYARWPLIFGPLFLLETPWRLREEIVRALPAARDRWAFRARVLRTVLRAPVSFRSMAARARIIEQADARADCARITAPTLIVTGEPGLDHVLSVDGSSEYAELIRDARRVTLERTGHVGTMTLPQKFADIVARFARDAGADAAA